MGMRFASPLLLLKVEEALAQLFSPVAPAQ
jgi:hypothetical protein